MTPSPRSVAALRPARPPAAAPAGVGVDRDYPLHRFFLLTEQVEFTLGSASDSLRRLGRLLADEPV